MLKKYGEKKLQRTCKSRSRRNLLLYNKVSVHMILTYVYYSLTMEMIIPKEKLL